MKIVNREEFLKLPSNTLYCDFIPSCFGVITVKLNSTEHNDWIEDNLNTFIQLEEGETSQDKIVNKFEVGTEFRWDDNQQTRNGMYDGDEVMFCIYDNEDILQLIHKLEACLK